MGYRISRNIEASIVEYIKAELESAGWTNVNVEKTFSKVYEIELPTICVRVGDTIHNPVELGSNSTIRDAQVLIDIFGSNDGNRLDLKDFLISIFRNGLVFNEYTIANGKIVDTVSNGRIRVLNITDIPLDFSTDKNDLDIHDRYRHLLTLTVSTGKAEE